MVSRGSVARLAVAALLLAVALLVAVAETTSRVRSLQVLDGLSPRLAGGVATEDPSSVTGLAGGADRVVTPFADSLAWILLDREASTQDTLRLRHTMLDNAPEGRPVAWALPYQAWVRATGWLVDTVVADASRRSSGVVLVAGPLLLAGVLGVAFPLLVRVCGWFGASLVVASGVTAYPLLEYFVPGQVDHHGLVVVLLMGAILPWCLAGRGAGWAGAGDGRARVLVSATAAALALQVSAATALPVIGALVVAAVADALLGRGDAPPERKAAGARVKAWGRAGGAMALVLSFVEAWPGHPGWRLETIHPLWALAWWSGAEFAGWLRTGGASRPAARGAAWAAALAAIALSPALVVVLAGPAVFRPADPFLYALHAGSIAEFRPLHALLAGGGAGEAFGWLSPLPLVVAVVTAFAARSIVAAGRRSALLAAGTVLLVTSVLALAQVRWLGLACGAAAAVLVVLPGSAWWRARSVRAALAALLLAMTLLAFPVSSARRWAAAWTGPAPVAPADLHLPILRDIAFVLRARLGDEPGRVLAGPTTTLRLMANGGVQGVATLYWENLDGLRRAAELFAEADPERVRAELLRDGITHVVLAPWDAFPRDAARFLAAAGRPASGPGWLATLPLRDEAPAWLRPLVLNPGTWDIAEVHVFEVVGPGDEDVVAVVREVERLLEAGPWDDPGIVDLAAGRLAGRLGERVLRRLEPAHLVTLRDLGLLARATPSTPWRDADPVEALVGAPLLASLELELALLHDTSGRRARAVAAYRRVLAADPGRQQALNNLAFLLACAPEPDVRSPGEALRLARLAVPEPASASPAFLSTLACALAATGAWDEAVAVADAAAAKAREAGDAALAARIEARRAGFSRRMPFLLPVSLVQPGNAP